MHDAGNNASFFDRLDVKTGDTGTFHLNVQSARSSFDVPNTYDQQDAGQAQHQKINTFNVAPGYSQVLGSKTLFTANGFVRRDHLTYTPSPDPFVRSAGQRVAGPHADQLRHQGGLSVHDRRSTT